MKYALIESLNYDLQAFQTTDTSAYTNHYLNAHINRFNKSEFLLNFGRIANAVNLPKNIAICKGFVITHYACLHILEESHLLHLFQNFLTQFKPFQSIVLNNTPIKPSSQFSKILQKQIDEDTLNKLKNTLQIIQKTLENPLKFSEHFKLEIYQNTAQYLSQGSLLLRADHAIDLPTHSANNTMNNHAKCVCSLEGMLQEIELIYKEFYKHLVQIFSSIIEDSQNNTQFSQQSFNTIFNVYQLTLPTLQICAQQIPNASSQNSADDTQLISGHAFSFDPKTGFEQIVHIQANYGLHEPLLQSSVQFDEYQVFKPFIKDYCEGFNTLAPITNKQLGSKLQQLTLDVIKKRFYLQNVAIHKRQRFCMDEQNILQLANCLYQLDQYYQAPIHIEWIKQGETIYLTQIHIKPLINQEYDGTNQYKNFTQKYILKQTSDIIASGRAIGQKICSGRVKLVTSLDMLDEIDDFAQGDILVTQQTDVSWEHLIKKAGAIITDKGGRTCHAAIVARELGIPAVVGCGNASKLLQDAQLITVSCAQGDEGFIYDGILQIHVEEVAKQTLPALPVKMMLNLGNPDMAFRLSQYPNDGVGLARLEFLINYAIGIHPSAILAYPNIDEALQKAIERLASGYNTPTHFYTEKLAQGIATMCAAFFPKPVIVRLSDFKSNEYQKLIGGSRYEPIEENPMLGFRGASRYLSQSFAQAFAMECKALLTVKQMGFNNLQVMVPFVRTLDQAKKVIELLNQHGISQKDGFKLIMMCEIPSNCLLAEEFLQYFDGFSIGSNDLTQLTLGIDRDSGIEGLNQSFDERNPAVKKLIQMAIQACQKQQKYISICGQAPSDYLEFANWLYQQSISSLSLNPDCLIQTWSALAGLPLKN